MKKGRDLLKRIWRSFFIHHNTAITSRQMNPSERYCYNPTVHWNPLVEEYFIKAYGADHFSLISKALTCLYLVYWPALLVSKKGMLLLFQLLWNSLGSSRWGTGITCGTVMQGLQTDPHYFERNGLYIGQGTTTLSRVGIFRVPQEVAVDMNNRILNKERGYWMCAAPGGKTTAIAILMKDKGEVIAVDRTHNKHPRIGGNGLVGRCTLSDGYVEEWG